LLMRSMSAGVGGQTTCSWKHPPASNPVAATAVVNEAMARMPVDKAIGAPTAAGTPPG